MVVMERVGQELVREEGRVALERVLLAQFAPLERTWDSPLRSLTEFPPLELMSVSLRLEELELSEVAVPSEVDRSGALEAVLLLRLLLRFVVVARVHLRIGQIRRSRQSTFLRLRRPNILVSRIFKHALPTFGRKVWERIARGGNGGEPIVINDVKLWCYVTRLWIQNNRDCD